MICRRWFHPNLSGHEAQELLLKKGFDGYYLVRPSKNTAGDYTLSVRQTDKVVHIKISNSGDCYHLYDYESFATLSELIQVYTQDKGQLTTADGEVTKLIHPLYSTDPTNERWYHGKIDGKTAETFLLERGERCSFLVRESISKPGSFVISVKVGDNEVTHVMVSCEDGQYRIPGKGDAPEFESLTELVEYYRSHHLMDCSKRPYYLQNTVNATLINSSAVKERIEVLEKPTSSGKTGFSEEFEQLQNQEMQNSFDRKEGSKPENKPKNRYKNILPFDHSRVVLLDGERSKPGSDYINANYITMETSSGMKEIYIATQGCLQNTVNDFWRMIWQENTGVIVCLTKLQEQGKNKCTRYWPDENEAPKKVYLYGDYQLSIRWINGAATPDYEIRELELTKLEIKGDGEEVLEGTKIVYNFHFATWPDKSVPRDAGPILDFIQKVHDHRDALPNCGPIVVHCSAGIGRTGAFIGMDYILSVIKTNGLQSEIDVQKTVEKIRSMRSGMVQTDVQYKFIYLAIRHYVETASQRLPEPSYVANEEKQYGNLYGTIPGIYKSFRSNENLSNKQPYENT